MPVNILNLPGLEVVDFRETDAEYHVRATPKTISRLCPSCGPAGKVFAVQAIATCNIHDLQLGEVLVLCGNSLRPWQDMDTVVHASAPTVAEQPPAQAPERLAALAHAAQSHPDLIQLDLFAA